MNSAWVRLGLSFSSDLTRCLPSAELSLATQKPITPHGSYESRTIFPTFSKIDSEAYEKKVQCVKEVRSFLQESLRDAKDQERESGRVVIQISACASDEEILKVHVEVSKAKLEALFSKAKGKCWSLKTAFELLATSEGDPPEEKALFRFFSKAESIDDFVKEVERDRKAKEKGKNRAHARNSVRHGSGSSFLASGSNILLFVGQQCGRHIWSKKITDRQPSSKHFLQRHTMRGHSQSIQEKSH